MSTVVEVDRLEKRYQSGFLLRSVQAVRDISFKVEAGQVFGFLGPNGAGKTTTIRVLMGLIRATSGTVKLFGQPAPSRTARARIGFLPESPYFYDYLTVAELLDLAGRLCGVPSAERRTRADELISLVGLQKARNVRLKKYSKGMLQRAGIAQSLIADPELVIYDEPMSGLDPVGRKEVRDIIRGLGERGKTVMFSSHILADVEMICDHVAFVAGGEVRRSGSLSELVDTTVHGFDISLATPGDFSDTVVGELAAVAESFRRGDRELTVVLGADADADAFLEKARALGARVRSVEPRHQTLEDLFLAATSRAAEDNP
ncbi:MAG TPA: ABC transporter ATP-binding protein [Kofleriaceae bacterium]|nr:ABC transporter ATP-binding protein [Kofleriaceae bacterium]